MPRVRALNTKKYKISKRAFLTAYNYCLQYREWKAELEAKRDTVAGMGVSDMPGSFGGKDVTATLAMERMNLQEKIDKIETSVREAVEDTDVLYEYLLYYVTTEDCTFNDVKAKGIPIERTTFYGLRKKFYCIISKKI